MTIQKERHYKVGHLLLILHPCPFLPHFPEEIVTIEFRSTLKELILKFHQKSCRPYEQHFISSYSLKLIHAYQPRNKFYAKDQTSSTTQRTLYKNSLFWVTSSPTVFTLCPPLLSLHSVTSFLIFPEMKEDKPTLTLLLFIVIAVTRHHSGTTVAAVKHSNQ